MVKKVYVTTTQVDAAKLIIERAEARGETASDAVIAIANAKFEKAATSDQQLSDSAAGT